MFQESRWKHSASPALDEDIPWLAAVSLWIGWTARKRREYDTICYTISIRIRDSLPKKLYDTLYVYVTIRYTAPEITIRYTYIDIGTRDLRNYTIHYYRRPLMEFKDRPDVYCIRSMNMFAAYISIKTK